MFGRQCNCLFIGTLVFASLVSTHAEAGQKGTYFLVEASTGLSESAYVSGDPGLSYGVSAGVTFRIPSTPLRWYVLGTMVGRNATLSGFRDGSPFSAERRDMDLYLANRWVVPLWGVFRGYFEVGIGQRFFDQRVRRREGALSEVSQHLLVVGAIGLQARFSRTFSLGIRGEMTPFSTTPDLANLALDLESTQNRMATHLQFGVHF